jgi:hypothetical protein
MTRNEERERIEGASDCIVLSIPIQVKKRSGRKQIITPDGLDLLHKSDEQPTPIRNAKEPIAVAVARAHRWLDLIERGDYANGQVLAKALGVDASYVHRFLRITLLCPDLIEDLLHNREPEGMSIEKLRQIPEVWAEQNGVLDQN